MIERLLPAGVMSAETFTDIPGETPFPGEETLIMRALEPRRREFITARRCARDALSKLGYAPGPILRGGRGEPQWPAGVVGSITHCAGYRAAAVAQAGELASLGIDAEPNQPLPEGVAGLVLLAGERSALRELAVANPAVQWDRLLYSTKESIFKAWYTLTRRELGFEQATVEVNPATATFRGRLGVDGARIDGGPPLRVLTGRYLIERGMVATVVMVRDNGDD
ncbi:4'-phosphopantetheinyl transferase family protein [Micromonospora sp. WMMC250]|uniref:4'-phosphopantetheinyl transferase family protein n=1 Tax=Micromonospora sp. WMMC250 TaxID=3014781 RepID=UPI0022B74CC7|nr:4'-phosphopantetheinyl transferase superfamily protein [Micromonospora sp. WMMC250]MCZ7379894.1 4'-phosphopantetheinyl transferase superfamily protein [Micromonospora sp. WMMC250]